MYELKVVVEPWVEDSCVVISIVFGALLGIIFVWSNELLDNTSMILVPGAVVSSTSDSVLT